MLLLAVAGLLFGVLAVVVPDRLFPPETNDRTISVLGKGFRAFALGSFCFALGSFATPTLDEEGAKGRARLAVTAVLPFSPRDARPVVRSAMLETKGRRTGLDSIGNALGWASRESRSVE